MSGSDVTVDLEYLNSLEHDFRKLSPYGWGVVDKDGNPRLAHDFFTRESSAHGFVKWATEIRSASAPFRVVQLFYKED